MIPELIEIPGAPWKVLPSGVHWTNLTEVNEVFGFNDHRRRQLSGLADALGQLANAGCRKVYLDGSFVTSKPLPGDYDCCWDHLGMDKNKLNPLFLDFTNKRAAQKQAFLGEFFPAYAIAGKGQIFIDFFQTEKHTGENKGILILDIKPGLRK